MNIPEIFRYSSIVSVPLFALVAIQLIRKEHNFSFRTHTISKSVGFLHHPVQFALFRFNFIFKAFLDLGFSLYVLNHFSIPFISFAGICLIISAFLFASLAYFTEGTNSSIHKVFAYISGVLWAIGQMYAVTATKNQPFILVTAFIIFTPVAIGLYFAKRSNAWIQTLCVSIWYIWLIVFVFWYL